MHEFNDELDGRAIALLELYRDAGAPPAEVEDRLLARIEAQAAIEADLEGDDHELIGAEPQPATETGVRPLTAVLIAIVAFAAGVALTVGLRVQMAQLVEDPFAPSVAPMTAEDPPAHEIAEPPAKDACGAAVLDEGEPVEEAEPVEREELDAEEEEAAEEDDEQPTARSFVLPPGEDDEPVDVMEGESIDEEPSAYGYGYALSPWSGGREDETRSSSGKRGSRSTRTGGYWAPTSIGSSSSSSPSPSSRPSTDGGARGPSTPKPSGGGNGKPVGNNGGGDRPPPPKPDPSTPPLPSPDPGDDDPPPPDDRPPEEPPPPDEPEPPPADVDPCAYEAEACNLWADESCAYDPDYCGEYFYSCDLSFQQCAYPDEMAQCEQAYVDCYSQLDVICYQQDPELLDPELQELCVQLDAQCNNDYLACMGYGDDGADPGQGVELDEYP